MAIDAPYMGWIPLIVAFALLFAINKFKNSSVGIALVFLFTGILGFSLGPILNYYLATQGGTQLVVSALSMTGIIFLSLSGYALITRKDFSFHGRVSDDRNVGSYRQHSPDAIGRSFRMAVVGSSFSNIRRNRNSDVRLHSIRH